VGQVAKRKTHEEFVIEVFRLVGDEYKVLGNYKTAKARVEILHTICKTNYNAVPTNFLRGNRCPNCARPNYYRDTEKFKEEINEVLSSDYTVIEDYKGIDNNILIKHNICGNSFYKTPYRLLKGSGCPFCFTSGKKNQEIFDFQIKQLVGDEYTFLTHYVSNQLKMKVIHNDCSFQYEVTPNDFLFGRRCPVCQKKKNDDAKRKSHDEYSYEVYQLVGNEYTVLNQYKSGHEKVLMKHNECGNEWKLQAQSFLSGVRCPKCMRKEANKKETLSPSVFKQRVKELVNDEYAVIGEYKAARKMIKIKHEICGHIFNMVPYAFIAGNRCPKCGKNRDSKIKTTDFFKKEVFDLIGNEYEVVGKYLRNNRKILIKHESCQKEYEVTPSKFLSGRRCPNCFASQGEETINNFLTKNFITFKTQYTFKDCFDKAPLRFDFAIFEDTRLIALIEYDGEQHFRPVSIFGGEKGYKERVKKDKIKNAYCKAKGIPLIRIMYSVKDIDNFLDEKLRELNINIQLALT
jgi:Zn ribbon nucleic-acid-binding protein